MVCHGRSAAGRRARVGGERDSPDAASGEDDPRRRQFAPARPVAYRLAPNVTAATAASPTARACASRWAETGCPGRRARRNRRHAHAGGDHGERDERCRCHPLAGDERDHGRDCPFGGDQRRHQRDLADAHRPVGEDEPGHIAPARERQPRPGRRRRPVGRAGRERQRSRDDQPDEHHPGDHDQRVRAAAGAR